MSRHIGNEGTVSVDGATVAYITGWRFTWGAEILRHRGASEAATTKYIGEAERTGSFACESDPSDSTHASLLTGGVQQVALVLTEESGATHSFDAIITPSADVPKNRGATRAFAFEEVG